MLSGPYSAVAAMISVSGEATAQAASRIFAVIEAVVLGFTRSSLIARLSGRSCSCSVKAIWIPAFAGTIVRTAQAGTPSCRHSREGGNPLPFGPTLLANPFTDHGFDPSPVCLAYTIPAPASDPCLMRRRRSIEMKKRLAMMTRNDTPVVTVPSA